MENIKLKSAIVSSLTDAGATAVKCISILKQ